MSRLTNRLSSNLTLKIMVPFDFQPHLLTHPCPCQSYAQTLFTPPPDSCKCKTCHYPSFAVIALPLLFSKNLDVVSLNNLVSVPSGHSWRLPCVACAVMLYRIEFIQLRFQWSLVVFHSVYGCRKGFNCPLAQLARECTIGCRL